MRVLSPTWRPARAWCQLLRGLCNLCQLLRGLFNLCDCCAGVAEREAELSDLSEPESSPGSPAVQDHGAMPEPASHRASQPEGVAYSRCMAAAQQGRPECQRACRAARETMSCIWHLTVPAVVQGSEPHVQPPDQPEGGRWPAWRGAQQPHGCPSTAAPSDKPSIRSRVRPGWQRRMSMRVGPCMCFLPHVPCCRGLPCRPVACSSELATAKQCTA